MSAKTSRKSVDIRRDATLPKRYYSCVIEKLQIYYKKLTQLKCLSLRNFADSAKVDLNDGLFTCIAHEGQKNQAVKTVLQL